MQHIPMQPYFSMPLAVDYTLPFSVFFWFYNWFLTYWSLDFFPVTLGGDESTGLFLLDFLK